MCRRAPRLSEADRTGMLAALEQAQAAAACGEVPVGAVVMRGDTIIGHGHNLTVQRKDLTQHAELVAIREALGHLGHDRLDDATLYVTLEPCAQCAGSIVLSRLKRVVYGAYDPKAGMAGSVEDLLRHPKLNHRPEVMGGVLESDCGALLKEFFESRR